MDINTELFRRTSPAKKLTIINNLKQNEVLNISEETIIRMVKETGRRTKGTRNYDFYIDQNLRTGNNWNSEIESISLYKGEINLNTYVQYSNTDTNRNIPWGTFIKQGDFRGTIEAEDRHCNPQTYYYIYDEFDKARVIRNLCVDYIRRKYASKLTENNNK